MLEYSLIDIVLRYGTVKFSIGYDYKLLTKHESDIMQRRSANLLLMIDRKLNEIIYHNSNYQKRLKANKLKI